MTSAYHYVLGFLFLQNCLPLTNTNVIIHKIQVAQRAGAAPLIQAIRHNRLDVMQLLIEHGADLEMEDPFSGTPVFVAGSSFNTAAVKLLHVLEHGANVNRQQRCGETVLFLQS